MPLGLIELSPKVKTLLLVVGAIVLAAVVVHFWKENTIAGLSKEKIKLEQDLTQKTDALNEALGRAHAFELQARELKLAGDAYKATVAAGVKNVAVLDAAEKTSKENYEVQKNQLGNCADIGIDECLKLYCKELRAAKLRVPKACTEYEAQ
jgi:hypothetical protein